jgi:hAT family C-terminal dimerisation region
MFDSIQMTNVRTTTSTEECPPQSNQPQQLHWQASQHPNRPTVHPTKLASRYRLPTMHAQRPASSVQTVEQELAAYTTSPCSPEGTDPLSFWAVSRASHGDLKTYRYCYVLQVSRSTYPTLYRIAMDHLPIQASAVPCERVFSSSSETMTKRRNRISPILLEALQMLKFFFKKERLNFTKGWGTLQSEMLVDVSDDDVLATIVERDVSGELQGKVNDVMYFIGDEEGDELAELPDIF